MHSVRIVILLMGIFSIIHNASALNEAADLYFKPVPFQKASICLAGNELVDGMCFEKCKDGFLPAPGPVCLKRCKETSGLFKMKKNPTCIDESYPRKSTVAACPAGWEKNSDFDQSKNCVESKYFGKVLSPICPENYESPPGEVRARTCYKKCGSDSRSGDNIHDDWFSCYPRNTTPRNENSRFNIIPRKESLSPSNFVCQPGVVRTVLPPASRYGQTKVTCTVLRYGSK